MSALPMQPTVTSRLPQRASPALQARIHARVRRAAGELVTIRDLLADVGGERRDLALAAEQLRKDGLVTGSLDAGWRLPMAEVEVTPELVIPPLRTRAVEPQEVEDDEAEAEPVAPADAPDDAAGATVGRDGVGAAQLGQGPEVVPPAPRDASGDPPAVVEDPEPAAAPAGPAERPADPVASRGPGAGLTPGVRHEDLPGRFVALVSERPGISADEAAELLGCSDSRLRQIFASLGIERRPHPRVPGVGGRQPSGFYLAPESSGEPAGRPTGAHLGGTPSAGAGDGEAGDELTPEDEARIKAAWEHHKAHRPCGRTKATPGWWCKRLHGHDGPCAAVPDDMPSDPAPAEAGVSLVPSADVGSTVLPGPEREADNAPAGLRLDLGALVLDRDPPVIGGPYLAARPAGAGRIQCGGCGGIFRSPPFAEGRGLATARCPDCDLCGWFDRDDVIASPATGLGAEYPVIEGPTLTADEQDLLDDPVIGDPAADDEAFAVAMEAACERDEPERPSPGNGALQVALDLVDDLAGEVRAQGDRIGALEGVAEVLARGLERLEEALSEADARASFRLAELERVHRDAKPANPDTSAELAAYRERERVLQWLLAEGHQTTAISWIRAHPVPTPE